MRKISCVISLFFSLSISLSAQEEGGGTRYSINDGTMIGISTTSLHNSYLSPGNPNPYHGWGIQLLNEQMKKVTHSNAPLSVQRVIHLSLSQTKNAAQTLRAYSAFLNYNLGYHYRFYESTHLRLLGGGGFSGLGGFMMNTQRGNNPSVFHLDLGAHLSGIAFYTTHIRRTPMVFRYQVDLSLMGLLFSPNYGQSYYELFNVENRSGMIHFSALHNKVAMRHYITCDVPLGSFIIRAGYLNQHYVTDVSGINARYSSHSLMIGLVKEFISFKGRQFGHKELYNSAYY